MALLPANAPEATGAVDVRIVGARSAKGMIRACLTRNPRFFPNCDKDNTSFKASVHAAPDAVIRFANVPPGDYAVTVLHDENENFKLDTTLGIPREGVGFSRNPRLVMSAPAFTATVFKVAGASVPLTVKLKYFL